jgi:hypothetical protein
MVVVSTTAGWAARRQLQPVLGPNCFFPPPG